MRINLPMTCFILSNIACGKDNPSLVICDRCLCPGLPSQNISRCRVSCYQVKIKYCPKIAILHMNSKLYFTCKLIVIHIFTRDSLKFGVPCKDLTQYNQRTSYNWRFWFKQKFVTVGVSARFLEVFTRLLHDTNRCYSGSILELNLLTNLLGYLTRVRHQIKIFYGEISITSNIRNAANLATATKNSLCLFFFSFFYLRVKLIFTKSQCFFVSQIISLRHGQKHRYLLPSSSYLFLVPFLLKTISIFK